MAEMRALAARPPFAGFALGSLVVIVSTVLPRRVLRGPRHRLLRALWYGLGSTLSGGLANLGLKIVSIGVRVSLEGDVQVCFNVDREGRPYRIAVRTSTNRVFEKPAIRAIRASRYQPLPDSQPVPAIKTCRTFRFRLVSTAGD